MQVSYHFALTKIQKLQNLKKEKRKEKKKVFFYTNRYCLKSANTDTVSTTLGQNAKFLNHKLSVKLVKCQSVIVS